MAILQFCDSCETPIVKPVHVNIIVDDSKFSSGYSVMLSFCNKCADDMTGKAHAFRERIKPKDT